MTNKELCEKVKFNSEKILEQKKQISELGKRMDALNFTLEKAYENIELLQNQIDEIRETGNGNKKTKSHKDFKVGDRVQFDGENETVVGEIQDINDKYAFIVEKGKGSGFFLWRNIPIKDLKPATDEPKCKFKVGDKVKDFMNDRIGVIKEVFDDWAYKIKFDNGDLQVLHKSWLEPYTEPRWTFTDDEKVILRNLQKKWKWIARDDNGQVFVYTDQPIKKNGQGKVILWKVAL